MDSIPTLDLFNFTEPIAAESQYILTSPRSLEACARFGIKPSQLLPKSHTEFEDEYGSQSVNTAVLYKNYESGRLKNLRLCRQERERIIDENEYNESDDESENDDGGVGDKNTFHVIDSGLESRFFSNKNKTARKKTREKPSILSYLDDTSRNSPRTYKGDRELKNLSDSEIAPVAHIQNADEMLTKKRKAKIKRTHSFRSKKELSLHDDDTALPRNMNDNPSPPVAVHDIKSLAMYIAKDNIIQKEEPIKEPMCCWDTGIQSTKKNRKVNQISDKNTMENKTSRVRFKNEEMDTELCRESHYNAKNLKWQPKSSRIQSSSAFLNSRKIEKQAREEHIAVLNDITEKHKRAAEAFQQRMRQKDHQRGLNKMKQQGRKEIQELQLQVMEKNLEVWQEQLKEYQQASVARASKVIELRNAVTSQKTHEKRYQKEMDHAAMKLKIEEEERLRQMLLKTQITLKDERSKLINNEKEEYVKTGRDAARSTRSMKQRMKEEAINKSFDKMAAHGQRMARLEQVTAKKSQSYLTINTKPTKNRSVLILG